jgi:hypothetical protein
MSILQSPKSNTVHNMGVGGDAIWCNAPTRNMQNIKDIYADQLAKTRETPCRKHVLPLLNRHGSKQLIYKNVICISSMFCAML